MSITVITMTTVPIRKAEELGYVYTMLPVASLGLHMGPEWDPGLRTQRLFMKLNIPKAYYVPGLVLRQVENMPSIHNYQMLHLHV